MHFHGDAWLIINFYFLSVARNRQGGQDELCYDEPAGQWIESAVQDATGV